jgi:hypothetical protein
VYYLINYSQDSQRRVVIARQCIVYSCVSCLLVDQVQLDRKAVDSKGITNIMMSI